MVRFLHKLSYKLIIIGILIGLLMTAQWKTPQRRSVNPVASFVALRDTNSELTKEQAALKAEIKVLRGKIDEATKLLKQDRISRELAERTEVLKQKIGLTKVTGRGIKIELNDAPSGQGSPDNITHAADLRDIVNVLWRSGAEAISINNERIVGNTAIDCIVNTILINSTKTTTPFSILAIGEAETLAGAINNKDNLPDLWRRVSDEGMVFKITQEKKVEIMGFSGSFNIKWAKGVEL